MNNHYCEECSHYTAWRRVLAWVGFFTLLFVCAAFVTFLIIGTKFVS